MKSSFEGLTVFEDDLRFFSADHRALVKLLVSTGRAILKESSEKLDEKVNS